MRYNLNGVCARYVDIEVDGDVIKKVAFLGGCSGNVVNVALLAPIGIVLAFVLFKRKRNEE